MSSEVYFTADTHFYHTGALRFRPNFSSVEEMNLLMVENWNKLVKKGDRVYHLGDFGFFSHKERNLLGIRKMLTGQIHLILGNHDDKISGIEKVWFTSVSDLKYIKINDQKIMLCHYAMRTWRGSHRGSWQLYGHSHGNLNDGLNLRSMDVGVDCNNWTPVHFDEVKQRMDKIEFKAVDRHE